MTKQKTHKQAWTAHTAKETAGMIQVQHLEEVADVLVIIWRKVLPFRVLKKTVEVPRIQFNATVADIPFWCNKDTLHERSMFRKLCRVRT